MFPFKIQPKAQEAPDRGCAKERDRLVAKLHELAMEGSVTTVIFALKARHTPCEGEGVEGGRINVQVNINLPSILPPEGYHTIADLTLGNSDLQ